MSHLYFDFNSFVYGVACESEENKEEHFGMLKNYIEDILNHCSELEEENNTLREEVDNLRQKVDELEADNLN